MSNFALNAAADLLRRNDTERMRREFHRIPRPVLLAIMDMAGIARVRPDNMPGNIAAYHDGMQALALEILARAGFDTVSILAAALTGSLEGAPHERYTDAPGGYPADDATDAAADDAAANPDF